MIVPCNWTVHEGHQLIERIKAEFCGKLTKVALFTHLESKDDPSSWDDIMLDREETSMTDKTGKRYDHPPSSQAIASFEIILPGAA